MSARACSLSLALIAFAVRAAGQDAPQPALEERVNRAIALGVAHLRKHQAPDGHWSGAEDVHPGGMTALCAFTLLKSGVRRSDASVQRALESVLATEFKSTYAHSVRLLFLEALNDPAATRSRAEASLDFLVATQRAGEWAYPNGEADASNTQFALLGLRAAHRIGSDVPEATLESALDALLRLQAPSSGFRYTLNHQPTGGITAASLAGLCVLRELADERPRLAAQLRRVSKSESAARAWLAERWSAERNAFGARAWTPSFHYPYLWAVERFCGLAGEAQLGAHDWYAEGATWLVDGQLPGGDWGKLEDTCFALLFLRRATVTRGDAPGIADAALDLLRAPRPTEPDPALPRLCDWLVAGPWRSDDPADPFAKPAIDARKLDPRPGEKLARREWKRVALEDLGWTNLDELLALECDQGLVALAAQVTWDSAAPLEALLWLDVEDRYEVYLDGARVASTQRIQGAIDGRESIALTLVQGEHVLVCLIEDFQGAAAFGARLSARDGRPFERGPTVRAAGTKLRTR